MKQFIKNRKKQKIAIITDISKNQRGLAFIMHGLGCFKEQPHIETFASAFKQKGYTVIRFDTTNSYGESDGNYADATTTNYYEDLEDVIKWSEQQSWYQEPFCMVGHSLGGICIALYAEKYLSKIKALAPISTVVSGKLSYEMNSKEELEEWKRTGWQAKESKTTKRIIKELKWSHMEDKLKYDLLLEVDKLTMPVLLIVGDNDDRTPVKHQRILFDKLSGKKEFHIIKNAPHTFRKEKHLKEIEDIFLKWIDSLDY